MATGHPSKLRLDGFLLLKNPLGSRPRNRALLNDKHFYVSVFVETSSALAIFCIVSGRGMDFPLSIRMTVCFEILALRASSTKVNLFFFRALRTETATLSRSTYDFVAAAVTPLNL